MNRHERRKAKKNNKHRDRQNPDDWVVTLAWYTAGNCWRLLDGKYGDLEPDSLDESDTKGIALEEFQVDEFLRRHAGRGALIVIEGQLEEHYGENKARRMIKSLFQAGWEVKLIPSADMPQIRREWEQEHQPTISMADIECTPEELAAENAVNEAIEKLVSEHKPEHLIFQLGVLFAQGLSVVPEEKLEEAWRRSSTVWQKIAVSSSASGGSCRRRSRWRGGSITLK